MQFFHRARWATTPFSSFAFSPPLPAVDKKTRPKTTSEYLHDFANVCNDNRWIYFLNGLVDGTNIYFSSCCNLALSYASAYHNLDNILDPDAFQLAANEFHSALDNPEIFIDTVFLGLGFVSFAALASFYDADDENNKNYILRQMAFCWPFLRDILKQLKWTFKGLRNTLAIIAQCTGAGTLLIPVLFPLAMVIGSLAALNRIFLRSLRDFRKKRMQEYETQHKEILQSTKLVHYLKAAPKSYDSYKNSWVVVDKSTVYYVDNAGQRVDLGKNASQNFLEKVKQLKTADIRGKMTFYLQYLLEIPNQPKTLNFYSEPYNKDKLEKSCPPDSYIYLSSPSIAKDEQRLFYSDSKGNLIPSPYSSAFHKRFYELAALAEDRFSPDPKELQNFGAVDHGARYDQLLVQANKIRELDDKKTPEAWKGPYVFLSAAFSGLCDGLYFYMATMTLAVFSPQIYAMLLVSSLLLVAACILARIHEEHQYQVKYEATVLYTKLSLSKGLCLALSDEIEALVGNTSDEVNERRNRILSILFSEVDTYQKLQLERHALAQVSLQSAMGTGLMNGLATQGVLAGFMSMVTSIWLGSSAIFLPGFVIACVSIGMVILVYCFVDAIRNYNNNSAESKRYADHLKNSNEAIRLTKNELLHISTEKFSNEQLKKINNYIRKEFDPLLDSQPIEWAEILRLFLAGLKKGDKTSIELFYTLLKEHDELWIMPALLFVSSVVFGILLAGRFIAKNVVAPQSADIFAMDSSLPPDEPPDEPPDNSSEQSDCDDNPDSVMRPTS